MRAETFSLNEARGSFLTAYLQEVGGTYRKLTRRPGILVIPGGGYRYCSRREADPVALSYMKAGYQAFVLSYSVGEHAVWPHPLEDYEKAMELIGEHAEEWHLAADRIAVIGFSAGGHLAAAAAVLSRNRPAAAILGYAVLNGDVEKISPGAPDLVSAVRADTCPCFLFASRTDDAVPVRNSLQFVSALEEAGVVYECHIYSHGPHGFSTGEGQVQHREDMCRRAFSWVGDSLTWLEDVMGGMDDGELTPPIL